MTKQAFVDLDSALVAIDAFTGLAEEFELSIPSDLQDPFGVNMAVITDRVLARGWWPEGFERKDGYWSYRYSTPGRTGN
ncbi:hypothetical protein [Xanthomonas arboricola]|uniref:hypothetical protein n=1 Tax=Xanthomonas arboricola TaxID=56448 RepID=UPI000CEF4962|nr:hypothetical protein [Xanthomonas arboricola]PPT25241.1 hypothetical protein XarbCFBP7614_21070 [Xanthomonas arboricola]